MGSPMVAFNVSVVVVFSVREFLEYVMLNPVGVLDMTIDAGCGVLPAMIAGITALLNAMERSLLLDLAGPPSPLWETEKMVSWAAMLIADIPVTAS